MRLLPVLVAGILTGDALFGVVPPACWAALFCACLVPVVVLWIADSSPIAQSLLLYACIAVSGAWIVSARKHGMVVSDDMGRSSFDAVVVSMPVTRDDGMCRCEIIVTSGRYAGRRIMAYMQGQGTLGDGGVECGVPRVGDGYEIRGGWLRPLVGPSGEKGDASAVRSYRRYLVSQGMAAQMFISRSHMSRKVVTLRGLSSVQRMRIRMGRVRERLVGLFASRGVSSDELSLVAAMTLGEKSLLTGELRESYVKAGASHILALSGMHLGVISALLSFLLVTRRWRRLGMTVVLTAVWAYVMLVGMPVSVVRAAVMFSVMVFSVLQYRMDGNGVGSLMLTAFVMLVFNPLSLYDVGFQLSFVSVLGILLCYWRVRYRLMQLAGRKSGKLVAQVVSLLSVCVVAQMAVAPLAAYHFGRFPGCFLLANIVAVPLSSAIICCALALVVTSPLPFVADVVAFVLVRMSHLMNSYISWVSALPFADVRVDRFGWPHMLLVYVVYAIVYMLALYLRKMNDTFKGYR